MLYHISIRSWEKINKFVPRIPESRCKIAKENNSIPRICLSDSIEGCLSGVPWGGFRFLNDKITNIMRVYEFDRNKILKENLLKPEDIKKYVLDAEITREHWVVNQNIKPDNSYIIILKDFNFDFEIVNQDDKNFKIYKVEKIKYIKLPREDESFFINELNKEKGRKFNENFKR